MPLANFMTDVRDRVNAKLESYFAEKIAEARNLSGESIELVEGVQELTLRGGKRFRPVVLSAAFHAIAPERDLGDTIAAGAALEVLQSYLLIHDDWMDQDEERRGGPATHIAYRTKHPDHLADSLAILAGDLGSAYSLELILEAPFAKDKQQEAVRLFIQIQKEVFFGQHLDITANPNVSQMHDLKTGSYTVRGPLLLGALLAGATKEQTDSLLTYGNPIGEAFQLADDLLGTFGKEEETGKPGNDLRNGKRTCLVAEVEKLLPASERSVLAKVLGADFPIDEDIDAAMKLMIECGAKANVEQRLAALLEEAKGALNDAPLSDAGKTLLAQVADRLAYRSS